MKGGAPECVSALASPQFKTAQRLLPTYQDDARAASLARDPVARETKVLIVGAGLSGVVAAVKLIGQVVEDLLMVDKAAGFGGTWYYNRYPGLACDIESSIYLPFLEETGYLPKERFSAGPEVLEQFDRVVAKWNLKSKAYLQTRIQSIVWDEAMRRWHVRTDRADHFTAQFVVVATGMFHAPKLPDIPGIDGFRSAQFHSGRWDYDITGGDTNGNMTKLADKRVGIIGSGASAMGIVPLLADSAKKVLVFQRTPSTIWARENWKNGPRRHGGVPLARLAAGAHGPRRRHLFREAKAAGVTIRPEGIPELIRLADFRHMEDMRQLVERTVHDRATVDKLKPWYAFMCKRPGFHIDYLKAFNKPNVELVDTDGKGVSRLTATGVVANGSEHEVDVLVYATGYDFFVSGGLRERTGIEVIGAKGQSLDEKWAKEYPSTLFGVHVRDFPNLFIIGPVQAAIGLSWLHTASVAADHIAAVVARDWARQVEQGRDMRLRFGQSCSPGYYNNEGKAEDAFTRWGSYSKGVNKWSKIMPEWREEGSMKGLERR
ncbi:cyclohexanone monooxygenase [Parachaetomium inaequale]|uniref:Cyclohexanone monooxygenase n=1 Tax=Parachaetomium inaequale TaxID=2588326 RepID=A0AAN6P895_9PEZI|nr:cyclohexanone monooxygenase [Parachaetomium inaequale]